MADYFNRNYLLKVEPYSSEGGIEYIVIEPPLTVEFDIDRKNWSSSCTGFIKIYNLNEEKRTQIRKDQYDNGDIRKVNFQAGYGRNLSLAIEAFIQDAHSVREGQNWITTINFYDLSFGNADVSLGPYKAGTPVDTVVGALADSLKQWGVDVGFIQPMSGTLLRDSSYSGAPMDILNEITGDAAFIDNNRINVIQDGNYLPGTIKEINAQSGLIGIPLREQYKVTANVLFMPELKIGQRVRMNVGSDQSFNTDYVVIGIHHRGIISGAVAGEATTSIQLQPLNASTVFRGI